MELFVQDGNVVDVEVAAAVTAGTPVIIGTMVGIPMNDGAIGDVVPMIIKGVAEMPLKSGGADPAFGDVVSFNETDGVALTAGATGDINAAGKVVSNNRVSTDTFVKVMLTPETANVAA